MPSLIPELPGDLVARNERGHFVQVDVSWIAAVVANRAWNMTLLHVIDGQRLLVNEPYEVVVAIVQEMPATMH